MCLRELRQLPEYKERSGRHLAREKRADIIDYSQLFWFTSDYFPMGASAIQHSYKQFKKQNHILTYSYLWFYIMVLYTKHLSFTLIPFRISFIIFTRKSLAAICFTWKYESACILKTVLSEQTTANMQQWQ